MAGESNGGRGGEGQRPARTENHWRSTAPFGPAGRCQLHKQQLGLARQSRLASPRLTSLAGCTGWLPGPWGGEVLPVAGGKLGAKTGPLPTEYLNGSRKVEGAKGGGEVMGG